MQTVLIFILVPANGKLMAISVAVCVAAFFCLLIFIRAPLLLPIFFLRDAAGENIAALASSDALNMIYHLTLRRHAHIRSLPFFFFVLLSLSFLFCSADLLGLPWF